MFLIPALVDAAEKGIMRRHHKALVADFDGSLESFESEEQRWHLWEKAETPVENNSYQIAFEMDGQLMCWQRETDGCRQFSGDCEVMYCEPKYCDCMIVQIKRCGDHMDLFTEADWDKDPTASGKLSTEYWRGIRVQYYDPSKWGSNATVDVGKALETTLSCMDERGCSCHQSSWFHWSYPQFAGNLVWSPAGNARGVAAAAKRCGQGLQRCRPGQQHVLHPQGCAVEFEVHDHNHGRVHDCNDHDQRCGGKYHGGRR